MKFFVSPEAVLFQALLAGLLLTLLTGWTGIKLASRLGLIDHPGSEPHKQHQQPTPIAGGMALILSLVVFFLMVDEDPRLDGLFLPALMVFAMSLWDDFRSLPAWTKFAVQALAAALAVYNGTVIQVFETPGFFFTGMPMMARGLDVGLTIFWLVGITNAFNLSDSADGEVAGLGILSAAFFMLGAYDANQTSLAVFCAALLGICCGLLLFNGQPAQLFLGDSGAQTLGFTLAGIAILYNPLGKSPTSSWFLPILLVGVPIFETSLVFFSRIRRRRPFYIGARDQLFHRLMLLGIAPGRAVLVIHLAALILDCLAFIAVSQPPLVANAILGVCILSGVAGFIYLDHPRRLV